MIVAPRLRFILRHTLRVLLLGAAVIVCGCSTPDTLRIASPAPATADDRHDHFAGVYRQAAVAADHPLASRAGVEMLQRGGNAVDAAVAASFCLAVVRPYSCGLGGGGFMLIHIPADEGAPARSIALNYRETAPTGVGPGFYETRGDLASRYGPTAAGVPGTVAGLLHALETYGTLDRRTVLAPAIRAAERGFAADAHYLTAVENLRRTLDAHPHLIDLAQPIWRERCASGDLEPGDIIRQPDLARTLRRIAERGRAGFYDGPVANALVETAHAGGATLTRDDLTTYTPQETLPLIGDFRGHTILAMPPPSSGGIAILQILDILEPHLSRLPALHARSPLYLHVLIEAMKHAFADRAQHLADAIFVDVPISELLDETYLRELSETTILPRTQPPTAYGSHRQLPDDAGTSHLSVVDADGMAVACTETINTVWGSLTTVPGTGIVLNNEMNDFTTQRGEANVYGLHQSDRNLPEPGKRPLSSMSPTIVLQNDQVVLIAGASGGPRIITGTLQVLLNVLVFGMAPREAVGQPRVHHQWLPDAIYFEHRWPDDGVRETLAGFGHAIEARDDIGVVQAIHIDADGTIRAASDPRKGGAPAGY